MLKTLHDGDPPAGQRYWRRMPVSRYWLLLVQDVVGAYYAHPYAWDEIGFGGPAYPRGYMRLENGEPEPWEVNERRYEWAAPSGSPSAEFTPVGGSSEHKGSPAKEARIEKASFRVPSKRQSTSTCSEPSSTSNCRCVATETGSRSTTASWAWVGRRSAAAAIGSRGI